MNQAAALGIQVFDRIDLEKTQEKAKEESSLSDAINNRDSLQDFIQQIKHEPPARQMRMVLERFLGDQIRLNELTQEIEINGSSIKPYEFDTAEHWMDEKFGIMGTKAQAQSVLKNAANRNRYHPVREYLDNMSRTELEIDLNLVAERVLGLNDLLSKALIKAWICGAVSKVYSIQGSPFIEVLTLISPRQGIGKSEFFKSLASPKWFGDSFAQTDGDKDRILCLHRSWINEVSELDQFSSKKDIKQLKGLISTTTDTIRVPYGSTMENKARQFVIGATSNSQGLFALDDEQRRFWAMEVHPTTPCGRLDIKWLRDNRDAIWATATRLFKAEDEASFKLSKVQREEVIKRNASCFNQESYLMDTIAQTIEKQDIRSISVAEVLTCICNQINPTKTQQMEVGGILKQLGYQKKDNQIKHGQRFRTLWINEDRKNDFNPDTSF